MIWYNTSIPIDNTPLGENEARWISNYEKDDDIHIDSGFFSWFDSNKHKTIWGPPCIPPNSNTKTGLYIMSTLKGAYVVHKQREHKSEDNCDCGGPEGHVPNGILCRR